MQTSFLIPPGGGGQPPRLPPQCKSCVLLSPLPPPRVRVPRACTFPRCRQCVRYCSFNVLSLEQVPPLMLGETTRIIIIFWVLFFFFGLKKKEKEKKNFLPRLLPRRRQEAPGGAFVLTSSPRQPRWCIFGGAGAPGYPPEGGLQRVLPPGGGPGLLRAGLGARACARVCAGGLRVRVEGSLGHAEQPCGSGEMGGSAPPLPSLPPPAGVPCSPAGLGAGWCRRGTPRERGGLWVQQGGRPRSVSLPPVAEMVGGWPSCGGGPP